MVLLCCCLLSDCFPISDGAMKSNRIGLSEYTARRLAELKARRAEADDTGAFSSSSSSNSASVGEAGVNDSYVAAPPPAVATQHPPTPATCSISSSNSNSAAAAVPPAAQLPSKNDSHGSSSSAATTASQSISAPAAAVSNGVSEGSPDAADSTSRHKQSSNVKPESNPSNEQRRIDKQDFGNMQVVTEPSRPSAQRRDVPHPSPFTRTGPHSNNPTTGPGSAVEVGTLSKMASLFFTVFYNTCLLHLLEHFALQCGSLAD